MKVITETQRLIIREIVPADMEVMLELHSDPEVHIYLGNQTITSQEEVKECISFLTQQYLDFGVGRWAMVHKKTNEFIGWTGLEYVTKEVNKHKNFYDLGYRLLKRYWGYGFATESAIASLEYAFDKLNLSEVYGMADIRNQVSNKILKKVGLKLIESFDHDGIKHNWYRLGKTEYIHR